MKSTYKIATIIIVILIITLVFVYTNDQEKMINPVKGAKLTSKFNEDRGASTHNGIDLAIAKGTPIIAPLSGIVTAKYTNSRGGNQLIITHKKGIITGYAHIDKTLVSIGDYVKQGAVIATVGNTGVSTGPHLHFTVRKYGILQDPLKFITT